MKLNNLLSATILAGTFATPALATDVKIGVLNDRSGVYADLSGEGSVVAARMAVEDFDPASKGLNVELISADHQNKPDIGSSIARQWFARDGVDVIVDVPTSSVALAVSQVARDENKVLLNSGGGTSELTGGACSPNTIHWTYDTWQLANGTGRAVVENGEDTWFFITSDYAFGHALERETRAVVEASGGSVVGGVRTPFPNTDYSSFLLQAQASGAKVIGLANAGGDMINSVMQASEFGITQAGQSLAGLLVFINEVHALGLEQAQGLLLTESFYWDLNEDTRAWSARFEEQTGSKPSMVQAGVYSSITHYLKAVTELGEVPNGTELVDKMKELPTEDILFGKGEIRPDGRKLHDSYLFRVKTPDASTGPWDYYEVVSTTPADQAFRPLNEGGCSLVK